MDNDLPNLLGNPSTGKSSDMKILIAHFDSPSEMEMIVARICLEQGLNREHVIALNSKDPDFLEQVNKLSLADQIHKLLEKEKMVNEREFLIKRNPRLEMPEIRYADDKDERSKRINRERQQYSHRKHNFRKK